MVFLFVKEIKRRKKNNFIKEEKKGWAWWHTPVSPALGKLRQEDSCGRQVQPVPQSEMLPQEKERKEKEPKNTNKQEKQYY